MVRKNGTFSLIEIILIILAFLFMLIGIALLIYALKLKIIG